jgi:hypothetical protein
LMTLGSALKKSKKSCPTWQTKLKLILTLIEKKHPSVRPLDA